MRLGRRAAGLSVVGIVGLLVWNAWALSRMQEKLDRVCAVLAERPAPGAEPQAVQPPAPGAVPRELSNIRLAPNPYIIEAPDQLLIEAVVKDPRTGATDRLPDQPIAGPFLVRPDGTVGLGLWGSVEVTGMTIDQAAEAVRKKIVKFNDTLSAESLKVVVDVLAYNSKRYYVIVQGQPSGETVQHFPITGSETVIDAVANVQGLPNIAAKGSMHIARRTTSAGEPWQTLPVDWLAITRNNDTRTNYQILAGDRIYVSAR